MLRLIKHLFSSWAWKMAWRDSRPVRWRLLLFSASIVFGVAALVTIGSLRQNLNDAVGSQAKSLLGADLMVSSRQPYTDETKQFIADISSHGGSRASEVSFTTMLGVGESSLPKLVSIRGLDASFPFYGEVVTSPPDAWEKVQKKAGVIVEASFLKNMNAKVGDLAKFGGVELPVMGVLQQAPPSASGFAAFSPTVITSLDVIKKTNLTGSKSMVFYRTYFKFPENVDAEKLVKNNAEIFEKQRLTQITAKKRSESIEKAISRLYIFFNLIGFSALFLGGIGVAGAIHIHISERLQSVATLRCLGCSSARAFAVYLAQSIAMGAAGTLGGIMVGAGFVVTLGVVISSLPPGSLPFAVDVAPVWFEIFKAGVVGILICVSFALLPLLAVRRVSPLAALRREEISLQKATRDPLRWLVMAGLVVFAFLLTWLDTQDAADGWKTSSGYIGFLVLAFLFLIATGKMLRWLTKKIARPSWPFVIRQGIASLHRPNNQTGLFMVSIGLGTFLIFTLILMQNILLQWLDPVRMGDRPNLFMVDVPPEEIQVVEKLISDSGVKLIGNAPIVQMRLTQIKGRPVSELVGEPAVGEHRIPKWILRREFRSTYRETLSETEKLVAGEWIGSSADLKSGEAIPVSFEKKLAADLGLKLGDEVTISIEGFGESMNLRIASLREVDWRSMNLNFFIVFPSGTLESYVSFNVLAAHSPDDDSTARLQQSVFERLPYVNTIDLSLILKTVQSILNTAGKTIQIMALFTVITGAIVLLASILAGRRIRIRESVLLRTLGATRRQISQILAVEYALLALMATMAGSVLALTASVLLGNLVFDGDPYQIPWLLLATGVGSVVAITVVVGMLLSRGISNQPPLQILRNEGAS
jgi:putative ABC transport system permease protein